MAKPKTRYTCQACGSISSRWQGQCPDCSEWNTLVQETAEVSSIFAAKHNLQGGGRVIPLVGLDHPVALPERISTGIAEFDRAIGDGIVPGSAMLVGGDPARQPLGQRDRAVETDQLDRPPAALKIMLGREDVRHLCRFLD